MSGSSLAVAPCGLSVISGGLSVVCICFASVKETFRVRVAQFDVEIHLRASVANGIHNPAHFHNFLPQRHGGTELPDKTLYAISWGCQLCLHLFGSVKETFRVRVAQFDVEIHIRASVPLWRMVF